MMKPPSSPLSPYGRKVKMTLAMKGLKDKVEIVAVDTNIPANPEITVANPLAKIPACWILRPMRLRQRGDLRISRQPDARCRCWFPVRPLVLEDDHIRCAGRTASLDAALAAGVREALPARGEKWHEPGNRAPAHQDRPRSLDPPGTESARLGGKPRLRPSDAGSRARRTSTPGTKANGAPGARSWWPGSIGSPRRCRPSREPGRNCSTGAAAGSLGHTAGQVRRCIRLRAQQSIPQPTARPIRRSRARFIRGKRRNTGDEPWQRHRDMTPGRPPTATMPTWGGGVGGSRRVFSTGSARLAGWNGWRSVGGTGALSAAIVAQCKPKSLISIDPSPGFVATARATVPERRAEFRWAMPRPWPRASASRDVVVSALVLNFVPDRRRRSPR